MLKLSCLMSKSYVCGEMGRSAMKVNAQFYYFGDRKLFHSIHEKRNVIFDAKRTTILHRTPSTAGNCKITFS